MAGSLGNMSLKTSVDQGGLTSGLATSKGSIQSFAATTEGAFASMSAGAASLGTAIQAALGPLIAITGVVALITSGFSRLTEVGKQTKQALALGVSPQEFQGLSLVLQRAGIESSQTGQFFTDLASKVHRAATVGGRAARAFESLGVNTQQLAGMSLDQQFLEIADSLQRLGPGAEQAAIATQIFGGHAAALLPQLQRGRAGLEEFVQQAIKDGVVLGDSEAEAAMKASKAWEDAKRSLSRAWDSISLAVAQALIPLIEIAAKVFNGIVAVVKPIINAIIEAWQTMYEIFEPIFTAIGEWFAEMGRWLSELWGSFGFVFPSIRDIVLGVFEAMGKAGGYIFDALRAGMGAMAIAVGAIWEYVVGNILAGLRNVFQFLQQLPDAIRPAWIDSVAGSLDRLTNRVRQQGQDLRTWGRGAINNFGQSARNVEDYFNRIRNRQRQATQEARTQTQQMRRDLEQAAEPLKQDNKAMIEGSQEAWKVQADWMLRQQLGNENGLNMQQLDALLMIEKNTRQQGRGQHLEVEEV